MSPKVQELIEQMRRELPAAFAFSAVGRLTGEAVQPGTLANQKSRGELPEGVVFRAGRKNLIARDPFLDWFARRLQVTEVKRSAL